MRPQHTRRAFLKNTAILAGAAAGARTISAPYILAAEEQRKKLRVAVIGCGGQGTGSHIPQAVRQSLVAIVDPDSKRFDAVFKKAQATDKQFDPSTVKTFNDYRKMFDTMAKEIDAVIIATPNHHHALPALMAMKLGIACYVEKPLCYNVAEARQMAEFARKYKVATQMGNQGHSGEGYRRLCEYIGAGAIGNVTEVYCWSDRANGGFGGRYPTQSVPAGMNWDNWIGPAPYRDFHKDLHPHEWHGWHDFGDGSLGNMGCHVMDGAHWALKLGHPTSIEVEQMVGGSDERYPVSTRIRWDYPAREGLPPVKVYWFDGMKPGVKEAGQGDTIGTVDRKARNRPPIVEELEKKYARNFGSNGTIYVGDKGYMHTGTYGDGTRIVPEEKNKEFPQPAKTLPRVTGGHHGSFFAAIRGGEPAASNFEVASKLTEMILLGCLAIKAGAGKKVQWDGQSMQCTNLPDLNRHIQRQYRKGWEV